MAKFNANGLVGIARSIISNLEVGPFPRLRRGERVSEEGGCVTSARAAPGGDRTVASDAVGRAPPPGEREPVFAAATATVLLWPSSLQGR